MTMVILLGIGQSQRMNRTRWLLLASVVPVALALAAACGSSDDAGAGAASGGASSAGKSSGTGGTRASSGGTKSSGGSSGVSGSGNDTGAAGAPATGSFDSIWKRASAQVTLLDASNPTAFVNSTVALPSTLPLPDDGRALEVYRQFQDGTLFTYAHVDGDEFYYRFTQATESAGDMYVVDASIFSLVDGLLTEQSSVMVGSSVLASTATYGAYTGDFPPSAWPTDVVELELPSLP
jgi:hypothetical protein